MTTASSLERTGDLSLYGTISMSLMIGLLVGGLILALLDRGGDNSAPAISSILAAARADQLRRQAVLGTPTDEYPAVPMPQRLTRMDVPPRGHGVLAEPGRHRFTAVTPERLPSLATMGLNDALARLVVDRVRRDAERAEFQTLISSYAR